MTTSRTWPLPAILLLAAGCGGGSSAPARDFAVGGTVTGLAGANLVLHLGPASPGQDLAVTASGAFRFPARLADGSAFAVAVKTQPSGPTQTCLVSGGQGTLAGADAAVAVACSTDTFTVGGKVTGLAPGSSLLLQDGGGDDLTLTANGAFTFATRVPSGGAYAVRVKLQPQAPLQFCAVAGGDGTVGAGDVTSVTVSCRSDVFTLGGTVTGLDQGAVTLRLDLLEDLPVSANGTFAFTTPLPAGHDYLVTVAAQPTHPWQVCQLAGAAGTMPAAAIGSVAVSCTTLRFPVGGAVSGLLRSGLGLQLAVGGVAGAPLALDADGSFTFPGEVTSGQAFLVTLASVPPTQACVVVGGAGVMEGAAVSVTVTCGCAAGLGDCDGVAANGCEHDVTSDVAACGACGHACTPASAPPTCTAAVCGHGPCDAGHADCDGSAVNGCETPTSSDPLHCGGCSPCALDHATAGCAGGACTVAACAAGYADCDGSAADGCETATSADPLHCGSCAPCALANATAGCAGGVCTVASCASGFADCDGTASNGCETATASDPLHCRSCSPCALDHATAGCASGTCTIAACDAGYVDCDGNPANGCESLASSDVSNCGGCGVVCSSLHGTPTCSGGTCAMIACDAPWADCQGAAVPGCETDTRSSAANCGSCGYACATKGPGPLCVASACVAQPSCLDILLAGQAIGDGEYTINPTGLAGGEVQVFCDMTTDGGGWTFFAHVNADYVAGKLFEADVGAYDPKRGDGATATAPTGTTYGLGGSVYGHLGATELMVTVASMDPLAYATRLLFLQFTPGAAEFATGPVPCDPSKALLFGYRLLLGGTFSSGVMGLCNTTEWQAWTAKQDPIDGLVGDQPLLGLRGGTGLGTLVGSGLDPLVPAGSLSGTPQESWWYAR